MRSRPSFRAVRVLAVVASLVCAGLAVSRPARAAAVGASSVRAATTTGALAPGGSHAAQPRVADPAAPLTTAAPVATDDTPPALAAAPLGACTTATVTTAPAATASVGQTVAVNVTSAGCAAPRYQYWVAPPGGGWTVILPYTSSAGIQWATTGLAPGAYVLEVWARDAASSNAYDTYGFVYFTLTMNCVSETLATTPAGTALSGASVTITATSVTGCPNPQYAYWVAPPGGSYAMLQNWTASNSIFWNTTGLAPGAYTLVIWARDASSTAGSYDTYAYLTFTLGAPCSAASISATPSGQVQIGASVALTASARGCPNPQFEYWALPPGGSWQLLRGYAASAGVTWSTTGLSAGSYILDVWARDAASGAAYDTSAYTQITVTTWTPCNSGTITVFPGTSVTVGTTLTLTATAVFGCASPEYEFWLLPPGGAWQALRGYGPINFIGWNTTGLTPGTYVVDIWAKDTNSGAFYDTFMFSFVTLR